MNIFISRKMRNFIVLAQTNSIAKAAEKLHMTASPFGKSIASLEELVGYALFTRKENSISLNKAGQELYQELFPIYQRLSAIDNEIAAMSHRQKNIVIGIDITYPTIIFDQLFSLSDKCDGITAQPFEFSENSVIDDLLDRRVDFIISPQRASQRVTHLGSLQTTELPPLRLGFLVSRRFENVQPLELLNTLPWLQMRFQNRANFESLLDAHFRTIGINPTIIYRPYSFMAKISAVEQGQFLTVVPQFAYRLVNPAKLKYFDAPNQPMYMSEYLYSLKNNHQIEKTIGYIHADREGLN
ncbi:LysR family transcriptional regulator SrsR [Hafnia paralvei]|uniref:LysR family transcriptional regulator n=1 Tax=Hafnia paralvei TaxID=546367 RepID=A0A4Q9EDN8_9GAMM|nr:LysR family transcriptional regulator [Hafnia paralvei]AJQ99741.1 LysR family transcriptional regulator YnfL [Enterobacteriaceae bacterium bta3-1]TBM21028.1 LysR family transcriptional regulator [Hafnia paralvei]